MSATDLAARRISSDAHTCSAGGDTLPADHLVVDTQTVHVGGNNLPAAHSQVDAHAGRGDRDLPSGLLLMLADSVDDLERVRIATGNRIRALIDDKGLAISREHDALVALLAQLEGLEHAQTLELRRAMRAHPLGPFVKRTIGLGEKQAARLIAAIGDPYIKSAQIDGDTGEILEDERPRRGPAELWAYCGFHVIDGQRPRRTRGEKANWSNTAKMRARLCAESCIKQAHSPYRAVYDAERAKWADRETTDGHKHNHALAVVAKAILRDLWLEGRRLAGETA